MGGSAWLLEGIAREISEGTGRDDGPVDALRLAALLGLDVRYGAPRREATTIFLPFGKRPPAALHWLCAHEIAHAVLALDPHVENTEDNASFLGAALLLPRLSFCADLRRTGWSLGALERLHPNAPVTAIARRIAEVRDAAASIWSRPRAPVARFISEGLRAEDLLDVERELARTCLATGEGLRSARCASVAPARGSRGLQAVVVAAIE